MLFGIGFATLVLGFHAYAVNTVRLQPLSRCTGRFAGRQPRTLRGTSAPVRSHDEDGAPLNPLSHNPITLLERLFLAGILHVRTLSYREG